MKSMTLHFISPMSQTSYTVTQVIVTTLEGDLTIYPNHAPMLATLANNHEIIYTREDGSQEQSQLAGGILHIQRDSVTIIVDT